MHIDIGHLTGEHTELCERYWELRENGRKFRYRVDELAEKYGVPKETVPTIVKLNSIADVTGWTCPECEEEFSFKFRVRSELTMRGLLQTYTRCASCVEKSKKAWDEKERKQEAAYNTFIEGKSGPESAPDSADTEPTKTPVLKPRNTATVRIKMGDTCHHIKFVDLAESMIRLTPGEQGISRGEVVLKGAAKSGDLIEPGLLDEYQYLISISGDGMFSISRVRTAPFGGRNALVADGGVGSGYSITGELWDLLMEAIKQDFTGVPESSWDHEEEQEY